jgi:ABC-type Fe3+ transport system permease subunit
VIHGTSSRQPIPRQRRRSTLPWWVAVPWAVACVVLVGAIVVGVLPRPVKSDPSPPGQVGALVWGNGVFANKLELDAWLRIRGASYEEFERKHPAAVKLLEKQ